MVYLKLLLLLFIGTAIMIFTFKHLRQLLFGEILVEKALNELNNQPVNIVRKGTYAVWIKGKRLTKVPVGIVQSIRLICRNRL